MFLYPPRAVAAAASTRADAAGATSCERSAAAGLGSGVELAVVAEARASEQANRADAAIFVRERMEPPKCQSLLRSSTTGLGPARPGPGPGRKTWRVEGSSVSIRLARG